MGRLRRLQRSWRAQREAAAYEQLVDRYGPPPWPVGYLEATRRLDERAAARAVHYSTRQPGPLTQIY